MVVVETILQMMALVLLGLGWRWLAPGRLPVGQLRSAITEIVFYLLLPALVLRVLWRTELALPSLGISAVACIGTFGAMLLAILACRSCRIEPGLSGAAILAASFGNVTYLGLPILTAVLGDWAAGVAIQYDLFASTPVLFTLGMLLASRYGHSEQQLRPLRRLAAIPALWAALLAVVLNLADAPLPGLLEPILIQLGNGVVPLMLLAVGLSLEWRGIGRYAWGPLLMVLLVQLVMMPLVVWWASGLFGFQGEMQLALVLEAAMPSMVLGLVICEHYKLDTAFYAAAITVSTLLSIATLPLWYFWFS